MTAKKLQVEKGNYPPEIFEEIRFRAYQLWEQRGGVHGFDVQDWLQAEEEVLAKYAAKSATTKRNTKPSKSKTTRARKGSSRKKTKK